MSNTTTKRLTSADLFALPPSKKVDRWLFQGELRESKVTKRNPNHAAAVMTIGVLLGIWLAKQPKPRGKLYGGEAYFRIRQDPETNVGIDVALATPEQAAAVKKKSTFVDGAPLLAVEVLSPNDKHQDIVNSIEEYLDCGVKQVWIVDTTTEAVTVHRANAEPVMYTRSQELPGGADLPGFVCQVAEIFE
ncbi:Uma2 family endonuclease [Gemmata sp. G18]|uniref:Uma2 family endonuclease n=1 Tax=Gemmata palustris TaxID=2822762 RepID=A0ABS5BU23_9BACT|nr:Uma2 family endonuclease [Gemmata palustris]MBP3957188.1 Uma2 family endonuclease [Gemmata palustris]